jgi:pimeloyl-ACP methyl ester carboxylesterase/GTPase SAR1 family protein
MGKKKEPTLHRIGKYKDDFCCKADIIFVHGLGGDFKSTWSPKNKPVYYFPKLLQKDLPDVRIWSLDYPAHKTNWTEKGACMSLYDRASNVINLLTAKNIGEVPIIFICHSLGGLLVKKILRISDDIDNKSKVAQSIKRILEQTKGVCFIATPHRGSNLANISEYINKFFIGIPRFSELVKELKANAPELRELDSWYRNNIGKLDVETGAFREDIKIAGLWVVDESSADPLVSGCLVIPIDANHEMICKPTKGKKSLIYKGVKHFVETVLDITTYRVGQIYEEVFSYIEQLKFKIDQQFPRPRDDFDITYTLSCQIDSKLNFKDLLKILETQKKIILTGPAGSGKSNILRNISDYFISKDKPPIFINLKNWNTETNNDQLLKLKESGPGIDNIQKKFDILLRSALGDLDISFVNSHKEVFNVFLIDGLNEISGNDIIDEIISTLDEYVKKYSREACIIMTTRDSRRLRFIHNWVVISVNQISENELKKQIYDKFRPSSYKNLSTHEKELLRTPYFLNMAIIRKNPKLGSAAEAIESFFKSHLVEFKDDGILNDLAETAFKIYEKKGGLSFDKKDFIDEIDSEEQKQKKRGWFENLKEAGIINEVGKNVYAFRHQWKHDYLVARYIVQNQERWKDHFFDIASFQSNSFEAISLALEQINDVSRGDTFLKDVYNWNWVATLDCLIRNVGVKDELFSDDLKVAIKAIITEKLFDPIKGTQEMTIKKLTDFPKDDEPNFADIKDLDSILNFIQSFEYKQDWFEDWKSIYLKAPERIKYNILYENDIKKIISEDSVLGWTASNVIRRFKLSDADQRQLRAYFEVYRQKKYKDSTNDSIKWRIVHALGRTPSIENKALFLNILKTDDEYIWVKYGAARSLVEVAALSDNKNFIKEIFSDLEQIIQTVESLPMKVIEKIAKSVFYDKVHDEWPSFVIPVLECIVRRYRNSKEEQMFRNNLSDFKKFIQEKK